MTSRLAFHPLVADDLQQAMRWYSDISAELAERFSASVDQAFDAVEANPLLYPQAFAEVRFYRTKSFPYLVLFHASQEATRVLGVFHGASDPDKWRRRLG